MYKFKRISSDYYSEIKELSRKAFGLNRTVDEIKRKYETDTFGKYTIGFLAQTEEGEPAAYYGAFPLKFSYNQKGFIVAQSGDTMTSPDHQRKGLFTKLAEKTYEVCEAENIEFVFGFPNENSLPGFQRKLNWKFHGNIKTFTLNSLGVPFCELAEKFKVLKSLHQPYVKWRLRNKKLKLNNSSIETFSKQTCKGYITRDLSYFEYKLKDPSNYLVKMNGFSLLVKVDVHLRIGAVGFFDSNQTPNFLKTVKKLGQILACKKAVFVMSENHWMHNRLKETVKSEDSLCIGFYQINTDFEYDQIEFIHADYDTF
ncbi:GNAT family N-acetyltransferase [bacterium]|nr:GNAT family N-acetyltransferase [bacterium]